MTDLEILAKLEETWDEMGMFEGAKINPELTNKAGGISANAVRTALNRRLLLLIHNLLKEK